MTDRISTLKQLQQRIRDSKGADRELDGRIGFAFGLGFSKNYRECCESRVVGNDGSNLTYSGLAYWLDFTRFTASLDACVALMRTLMPDAYWSINRTALRPGMIPGGSPHEFRAEVGDWGTPCKQWHDSAPHALLLAIIAAHISELEAKQTEKTA